MLVTILTIFGQHFGADGGVFFAEVIRGFHPANREEKSTELRECSEAPDGRYLFPCCEVVVITALVGDIASSCSAGYSKSTRFHMISIDFLIFTDFLQCPR